jgi:hypothetical protein
MSDNTLPNDWRERDREPVIRLKVRCVNAHDRCDGGPCPYCEPVHPLRGEDGRFARGAQ